MRTKGFFLTVIFLAVASVFVLTQFSIAEQMEWNVDRMGSDYENFDLSRPNPEMCLDACMKDPKCKAWTYVKPKIQGPKARCWLKNSVPHPQKSSCCVSGVKHGRSHEKPYEKPYGKPYEKPAVLHSNLTGPWHCNDGGMYYIRQLGNKIWWYGERSLQNPSWSNVAQGEIYGNEIRLQWADVPKGHVMGSGSLILNITHDGKIVAKEKTGGFGGSVWTKR